MELRLMEDDAGYRGAGEPCSELETPTRGALCLIFLPLQSILTDTQNMDESQNVLCWVKEASLRRLHISEDSIYTTFQRRQN